MLLLYCCRYSTTDAIAVIEPGDGRMNRGINRRGVWHQFAWPCDPCLL